MLGNPDSGKVKLKEHRKIQAIHRVNGLFLADGYRWVENTRTGEETEFWRNPIVSGSGNGHLIRLESGDWIAPGFHWDKPEDKSIQPALKMICDLLKTDRNLLIQGFLSGRRS